MHTTLGHAALRAPSAPHSLCVPTAARACLRRESDAVALLCCIRSRSASMGKKASGALPTGQSQYQVVGRFVPNEKYSADSAMCKVYRMNLFARNNVVARSRFWYFMGKLCRVKKANGQIISINKVRALSCQHDRRRSKMLGAPPSAQHGATASRRVRRATAAATWLPIADAAAEDVVAAQRVGNAGDFRGARHGRPFGSSRLCGHHHQARCRRIGQMVVSAMPSVLATLCLCLWRSPQACAPPPRPPRRSMRRARSRSRTLASGSAMTRARALTTRTRRSARCRSPLPST